MKNCEKIFRSLTILFLSCGVLIGQDVASLQGRVLDETESVIPGVSVAAINVVTNFRRQVITENEGRYVFLNLPVGEYVIRAELAGFKTIEITGIILQVRQKANVDIRLQVGEITEKVNVTGSAPVLQTTTGVVGQVIDNRALTQLPLDGRSFTDLAAITPGVVRMRVSDYAGGESISVQGESTDLNEWSLDGTTIRRQAPRGLGISQPSDLGAKVSVDAIQEFKVETNAMSADKGRAGVIISAITKSGTNEFHGTLFEFIRNDALNARNFFAQDVPPQKINQFGGSLGGPIVKDKLFFFFNYEGQRSRTGQTFNSPVPSEKERSGDFSGLTRPLINPATIREDPKKPGTFLKDPFPGNVIPVERMHPATRFLRDFYPLPNTPAGTFSWSPSAKADFNQYTVRGDWQISEKHRFYVRHNMTDTDATNNNIFPKLSPRSITTALMNSAALGYTRTFSPFMVNELRLSLLHVGDQIDAPHLAGPKNDFHKQFGIKGFELTTNPLPGLPAIISISGVGGFTGTFGNPLIDRTTVWNLHDTLSYVKGSHTIMTGIDFRLNKDTFSDTARGRGQWSFDGRYSGNAFADFLLGHPSSIFRQSIRNLLGNYTNNWHSFFQDDWQVRPDLTLNLGLRYEYNPQGTAVRNAKAFIDPKFDGIRIVTATDNGRIDLTAQSVAQRAYEIWGPNGKGWIVRDVDVGLDRSLRESDKNDLGPRVGLAWRFARNSVLRLGAGIFYVLDNTNGRTTEIINPPWLVDENALSDRNIPNRPFHDPFLGVASPSPNVRPAVVGQDPEQRDSPYLTEWNLAIQHLVKPLDLSMEVAYLGKKGTRLPASYLDNVPPPGPGDIQARRRLPELGVFGVGYHGGNSIYHALQLRATRRAAAGLFLDANYTWSKSINDGAREPNESERRRMRRVSDFNVSHIANISYIYELPFAKKFRGVAGTLLGGWQITGVATFHSGRPFTPTLSGDIPNTGRGTPPNRIGSGKLDKPTITKWFRTEDFTSPAEFTFGNSGQNILEADGVEVFDFGLFKNFPVGESSNLQFRGEFFNLFNHPDFGPPVTTVNVSTAGRVFSAGDPRTIQFALKYTF